VPLSGVIPKSCKIFSFGVPHLTTAPMGWNLAWSTRPRQISPHPCNVSTLWDEPFWTHDDLLIVSPTLYLLRHPNRAVIDRNTGLRGVWCAPMMPVKTSEWRPINVAGCLHNATVAQSSVGPTVGTTDRSRQQSRGASNGSINIGIY